MSLRINKNITVLIILYNTPLEKIINLKQYETFKLIILEQGSLNNSKKKIKKILGFNFRYFHLKKNLGLSKGINYLIRKSKTKYSLITEPDIIINKDSIINLKKTLLLKENYLIASPRHNKQKKIKKNIITKKIDLSCVLFETKKILRFNFYDEDFFFFWTDVDLIKRINDSNFEMVISKNSYVKHFMSSSSSFSMYVNFLRDKSYKYGELVFDYKYNNLRFLKVFRQLIQSSLKSIIFLFLFDGNKFLKNSGYFCGIIEFLFYFLKKFKV